MPSLGSPAALIGLVALSACAVAPPTGPTVWVLPGAGKDLARFRQEDGACRRHALGKIGYDPPRQAADRGAGGGAVGTTRAAPSGSFGNWRPRQHRDDD